MLNVSNITPPRVPLTDPKTGIISREWYRFFLNLFTLTGSGTSSSTLEDLQVGPPTSPETFEEINRIYNAALLNSPPVQLGTLSSVNQDNVRYLGFQTVPALNYTPPVGTVYWNGGTTLTIQNTTNVAQPVGEAQYYYIKATAAITKGQLIMFTGSVGSSGQLTGAPATGVTTGEYLMGVAAEDIPLNSFGVVTSFGLVRGFNTTGGAEAWVDGQILYYDPATPGKMTKTIPSAPNVKAIVAAVVNAAPGGSGSVFVRVTFGSKLGETDSNVQITSLANNDLLQYDSALGYWKNVAQSAIGVVSSFSAGTTGFTPSTATTGAVTLAGTLNAVNGGTGQTVYAVGDILYANTTTTLAKLADVATGNALISGGVGVAPSWGKIGLTTHVSGTLAVGNGGTGLITIAANRIPYASALDTISTSANFTYNGTGFAVGAAIQSGYSITSNLPVIANFQGTNITPDASWSGQFSARGSGYTGGIALDGTGLWLGHNSAARQIVFAIQSAAVARFATTGELLLGTTTVKGQITMPTSADGAYTGNGILADSGGFTGVRLYQATLGNLTLFNIRDNATFGNITFETALGEVARITRLGDFLLQLDGGNLGYGTGTGGAVTQATSRTTGVTLNKTNGAITLFTAAPVVGTWFSFTVTNSTVAATDTVIVSVKSSANANTYIANVSAVAAGSFRISAQSIAGTASDAPVINFAVINAVTT